MQLNREQRRQMERENAKRPAVLTQLPVSEWPEHSQMEHPPFAVWISRDYLVQLFDEAAESIRITVCRTAVNPTRGGWKEDITWDELQTVKRQIGLGGRLAVEIFPADRDVVNVANMRHLWVLRDPLPIGWVKS